MTRNGQRISITVFVTAIVTGLLIAVRPEIRQDEPRPAELQAQVIRPAKRTVPRNRDRFQRSPRVSGDQDRTARRAKIEPLDEIWQVIHLGKHRIGYSRTTFERVTDGGSSRIRTTSEVQMSVLRFGQTTRMRAFNRTLETASGDLLSFEMESGSGRKKTVMTGRLEADGRRMVVETHAQGRRNKRYYDWRKGIKSPTYQDRLLRTFPMKPGEIRRFKTFDPEAGRLTEVRLAADDYELRRLPDGRRRKLLRVRVTQSISPTETLSAYLDGKGRPILTESEFIGKTLSHFTVPKPVALKAIQNAELDLGLRSIIRTVPIRDAHKQRRIVYRIRMTNDDPARFVVADDRQQVRRVDETTIDLTVLPSKLPRRNVHVKCDTEYVAASRSLQSNNPRVREHARRAAGYDTDEIRIAVKMEKYVAAKIKDKNFSTALATAADVARDMQGDCTEHAMLLAAMLRVRRIPSRIAVGLVYDARTGGFVSHMWTEAWLSGRWIAFDATRGERGVGPAHIKLAHASFADKSAAPITAFVPLMNVLGKWRIEIRDKGQTLDVPQLPRKPPSRRRVFPFRRNR